MKSFLPWSHMTLGSCALVILISLIPFLSSERKSQSLDRLVVFSVRDFKCKMSALKH